MTDRHKRVLASLIQIKVKSDGKATSLMITVSIYRDLNGALMAVQSAEEIPNRLIGTRPPNPR